MKKRTLLLGGAVTLALALGGIAFVGCTPPEEPDPPEVTETVRYTEKTNPYKDVTWQEIKSLEDWTEKAKNTDEIYYQFEGSYSEAYQENYSRTFMYMNCYKDGGLHARYGNDNYYGYWTNVDRKGKTVLVLHILRYNDGEYNDGVYELVCQEFNHNYYEYQTNIIWNQWGTRMVPISGGHYSPVKNINVSGGQTSCILGDSFSTAGLEVELVREDGKSIVVDEQSFAQRDCPVKFDGFDSTEKGEKTINISYENSDVTASYKCNVYGLSSISVEADKGKTVYHMGDKFETTGIVVKAAREDNQNVNVDLSRCKFEGYDANKEGKQTVTVTFGESMFGNAYQATYEVDVKKIKSFSVDAAAAQKDYYIGDKLNSEGLVLKATFEDDVTDDIEADRVTFKGFDTDSATDARSVTVEFQGLSATYDIKVSEPEFTGTGKYGDTKGEVKIKIVTPNTCQVTFNGKTASLEYSTFSAGGQTVYSLVKPQTGSIGITDAEWDGLHKQYTFDREDFSLSMTTVYKIPDQGADRPTHEPMPGIGGNTEQRYIFVDEEKGEATITYKYWYAQHTDTFVAKYTIEGDILTFTDLVQVAQVGGNNSQYGNLHKTWKLNADFTATKYTPPTE